jgi:3-methyl-2-oxobutanoate hydroxymethyltransferase
VLYDMLDLYPRAPKFSKNFLAGSDSIETAVRAYVAAVKDGSFPAAEHAF